MIDYTITKDIEQYKGYGYTLVLRNVVNPITKRENLLAETSGGNLVKLKFVNSKSGLSLNILQIDITKNLLPILDEEYNNAVKFMKDFEEIKKQHSHNLKQNKMNNQYDSDQPHAEAMPATEEDLEELVLT